MAKSLLSREELEKAVLTQIRSCYGCIDVSAVVLNEISDPRFDTNWAIASLSWPDDAARDVKIATHNLRAIAATQDRLRRLYNLGLD